ncbi:hypothetical protein WJX73_009407 [Symbiochloris irregularis]|uniref:Protein kinase domain-containing protein n=1 Tax=Symbiochloris irregularis TaxID=706552 RepID=A0AAW1PQB7_9CHLO
MQAPQPPEQGKSRTTKSGFLCSIVAMVFITSMIPRAVAVASFATSSAASVADVFTLMQSGQVYFNITISGDLHLIPDNWPTTVVLDTTVFLIGSASENSAKPVLDFGSLVNAIQVRGGAALGFENLLLTGFPWEAQATALTNGLPNNDWSNSFPSVVVYPNGTLIYNNSDFETEVSSLNLTCPQYTKLFTRTLQHQGWAYSQIGQNVTLFTAGSQPIEKYIPTSSNDNDTDTASQALLEVFGEQTYYCHNTSKERPNVQFFQITLDHLNSSVGGAAGQASSGLSGGAIAGVAVGSAAGAAALAALGFFMLSRLARSKPSAQRAVNDKLLISGTTATTSSAASKGREVQLQWDYVNPLAQLQAAAGASATFAAEAATQSNAASSVGHMSGAPLSAECREAHRCMMQFDWHIQPNRLEVCGGTDAVPIGVGGYGVVFKAKMEFKLVAVKFLHPAISAINASHTARFIREIELLRACRDKHVVDFLGAWVQQDLVYMVLELMETDLLKAIAADVASAKCNTSEGRQLGWYGCGSIIALDILQGLHYLHSNNVLHLDVKSGNILLASDGTAKIADVGLAQTLSKSKTISRHHGGGTLAWQSPEMVMGEPASFSADMWSFGVILLEIVTGQIPERSRYHHPRVPEDCPSEIADLIKTCMAPAPAERPSALQAIQIVIANTSKAPSNASKMIANTSKAPSNASKRSLFTSLLASHAAAPSMPA